MAKVIDAIKDGLIVFKNPLIQLDRNKVKNIVLHHPMAKFASVQDIHKWHLQNGWNGFGYNEYIRKNGDIYIGRGMNIGAQVANNNSTTYGICLEGDFRSELPTQEQILSLGQSIEFLERRFPNYTGLKNHWEYGNSDCPSMDLVTYFYGRYDRQLEKALEKLFFAKVINLPTYWRNNAKRGGQCEGEYVRELILNIASRL
jgi:N-acetylmuramoyl-L-alanine amidase